MTASRIETIVRNLKLFNAKERDHLMRFAYLGENAAYDAPQSGDLPRRFLDKAFDDQLKGVSGVDPEATCVFAGMDYHLDWLFAALWLSNSNSDCSSTSHDSKLIKMDTHVADPEISDLYTDFRPVIGNQEDVDLLVVYRNADKFWIIVVEAKGSARFDRVQLARKLIRLDRIIMKSGVDTSVFRLVLASPEIDEFREKHDPQRFMDCLTFAQQLPTNGVDSKYKRMIEALKDHKSEIGKKLLHLPLKGFPQRLFAIRRHPSTPGTRGAFTDWSVVRRKP